MEDIERMKLALTSHLEEDDQCRIHIVNGDISLGWIDKQILYENPTHAKHAIGRIMYGR